MSELHPDTTLMEKVLWDSRDLQKKCGFSRPMAYQMLNRADMPVVVIGSRRFMNAELFCEWLKNQAMGK